MQTVIWDWNGTIVNDAPYSWRIFNKIAESRGIRPLSFNQYQSIYGHPIKDMWERGGFDFSSEPFELVTQEWHDLYLQDAMTIQLHEDACFVLHELRARKITQAVLSALPHHILIDSVRQHGLVDYFHEVSGLSDLNGESKVDNGSILLTQLNCNPKSTILVGDSSHDAEVATALGIRCVLVDKGYEDSARLKKNGYPVLNSLTEVFNHLVDYRSAPCA